MPVRSSSSNRLECSRPSTRRRSVSLQLQGRSFRRFTSLRVSLPLFAGAHDGRREQGEHWHAVSRHSLVPYLWYFLLTFAKLLRFCCSVLKVIAFAAAFAGGYDRGECLRLGEEYEPSLNSWRCLAPMQQERGRFDAVVCDGRIFALGGSTGIADLPSTQCYDMRNVAWMDLPPMIMPRSNNGITAVNE